MKFNITDHIEFDDKGRAHCPVCVSDGKKTKNLSLIPDTDGAYKCHRGCSTDDIRAAIGQPKSVQTGDRIIPTALAQPKRRTTHTESEIESNHQTLMTASKLGKKWLNDRGFTDASISKHRLGICKRKFGAHTLGCVTIPYEIEKGVFQRKYRIAPWLSELPDEMKDWTQDTGLISRFYFTKQEGNKKLILCEGDWDAILLNQVSDGADFPFDIATNTTGCGNIPVDLSPIESYEEIYIFYDLDHPDEKGKRSGPDGAIAIAKKIGDRAKVCTVPHPENPKNKYDISDSIKDGFTLTQIAEATTKAIAPISSVSLLKNSLKSLLTTTAELMARAKDYVDWLVEDLLPMDELIMLAAGPRAGKSLLAMHLAQCIASGENFMDRPVMKGPVIYIHCEDSETKIKMRAVSQGWDENIPVYWLQRFKMSQLQELIQLAKEIQPRMIVLDTLSRIRDDQSNESSAEMGRILEPLQEFAMDHGCCVLLVHHTGKIKIDNADTLDVFETIRGSSAIRATCRGSLVIAADSNGYRLCVENGHTKLDLRVSLNLSDLSWKLLGKWGIQANESLLDQVMQFLTKHQHATLEQIFDATLIKRDSLYKTLSRLVQQNLVTKTGSRRSVIYSRCQGLKNISDISDTSDMLSDTETVDVKSVDVISDKNTFSYTTTNTHDPKSDLATSTKPENLSDCPISTANQDTVSVAVSDKLSDKPKTVRYKGLKVGDRVGIIKGFFVGATGTITSKMGLKFYVESPKWVQANEFTKDELRLLS